MTLTTLGTRLFGTEPVDLAFEISRYSKLVSYVARQFASARCGCGAATFAPALDDNEGAAGRTCSSCEQDHPVGDSDGHLDGAELVRRL